MRAVAAGWDVAQSNARHNPGRVRVVHARHGRQDVLAIDQDALAEGTLARAALLGAGVLQHCYPGETIGTGR